MGNGAKAAGKRLRNGKKETVKAKSQSKANEAAKNIVCATCKQPFMNTTRAEALETHSTSKHSLTIAECFPNFGVERGITRST